MSVPPKKAWILVDAQKVGSLNQCLGLAQALGYDAEIKKIELTFPYNYVSPFFKWGVEKHAGVNLLPPYPDLIIASGRQAAGPAAILATHCKSVFILNPYISPKHFDAVIVPKHDALRGENVFPVLGSLHGLNAEKVSKAAALRFSDVKKPVISVLIGGDSQHFRYTEETLLMLKKRLLVLKEKIGAQTFLITPSRRTRPDLLVFLNDIFATEDAFVWDFTGDNPYHAMLGAADVIVATSDSISMTTEACGVGKPVLIEDLKIPHPKFRAFYNDLFKGNYAISLEDIVTIEELPTTQNLDEMNRVIDFLRDSSYIKKNHN